MVTTKTIKARRTKSAGAKPEPVVADRRELKAFYDGAGQMPDFSYARFYWAPGPGRRESLLPHLNKKRKPAAQEAPGDTAARVEALPTPDAPQDYADADFLMRRYEEMLPHDELTAFAQVTLRFGSEILNVHHPYEVARQWLRDFYVVGHGAPVIAILHAPHLVGSENPAHVHGLVLPRRLTRLGWAGMERDLASDLGHREAFESWSAFRASRL
jgi:hypothetical protein